MPSRSTASVPWVPRGLRARGAPPPKAQGADLPSPAHVASSVRSLPTLWKAAVQSGDRGLIEEAARLRDEMHAVTMRIERVLASPGARLGNMSIEIPTASARGASAELVLALLGFAAERLAVLLESLQVEDWHIRGGFGSGTISVYELACMPLHTSARGRRGHAVDHVPRLTRGVGATR